MELYFLATGIKHELDLFESIMQSQPFLLPFKDKDGKEWKQPIYGNLAPIQLYRFIFPKEYQDEVIKMLQLDQNRYPMFNKQNFLLRKVLKAKKIPKIKADTKQRPFYRGNIGLVGIGIKEDIPIKDTQENEFEGI